MGVMIGAVIQCLENSWVRNHGNLDLCSDIILGYGNPRPPDTSFCLGFKLSQTDRYHGRPRI